MKQSSAVARAKVIDIISKVTSASGEELRYSQ